MDEQEKGEKGEKEQDNKKKGRSFLLKSETEDFLVSEQYKLIKEINFDDIPDHPTIMIAASRGQGKTYLNKHLVGFLHKKHNYEDAYLFSKTVDLQVTLESDPYFYIPIEHRYTDFDEEDVESIRKFNEECRMKDNIVQKKYRRNRKILIILDDMIEDRNATHSKALKSLFTRGRHSYCTIIVLSQTLSSHGGFDSVMRKNTDLFISFDIQDENTREMAAGAFASKFGLNVGMKLMDKISIAEPFMSTMIINRHRDDTFMKTQYSDYIFKYKAPSKEPKHFVIGGRTYEKYEKTIAFEHSQMKIGKGKKKLRYFQDKGIDKLKVTDEYYRGL